MSAQTAKDDASFKLLSKAIDRCRWALYAIYALPQGIPVADLPMGGIGAPWPAPPVPGCIPVFIASDSEGKFGFQCERCEQYWRARGGVAICPYCGVRGDRHNF